LNPPAATGWCPHCQIPHRLESGPALPHARHLMARLEEEGRIDFTVPAAEADPHLSTDYLFGKARGQMFGVLTAEDGAGDTVILRAFSGMYNGRWEVDGWAKPLFSVADFHAVMDPPDIRINALGAEMKKLATDDPRRAHLKAQRRALSRATQKSLHQLYTLHNFRGETAGLVPFYQGVAGPPTGAGDCCAPKLLDAAARRRLRPTGLAEFFFGTENLSRSRAHGVFYERCADKCAPILGWMLCGGVA